MIADFTSIMSPLLSNSTRHIAQPFLAFIFEFFPAIPNELTPSNLISELCLPAQTEESSPLLTE